jgi:hypothetical protein
MKKGKILKILALVLTFAMVLSMSATAAPQFGAEGIRRGVVLGNDFTREPNVNDALQILRFLVGLQSEVGTNRWIPVPTGGSSSACAACTSLSATLEERTRELADARRDLEQANNTARNWEERYNNKVCPNPACGQAIPACSSCTGLQTQLNTVIGERDHYQTEYDNAERRLLDANDRIRFLENQWSTHVCPPGGAAPDPLGAASPPLPGHAPRTSEARGRINNANENVFVINFATRPGGPTTATNVGDTGHFVRFNEGGTTPRPNTLHIRRGGTYVLSGNLTGSIFINAFDRPYDDQHNTGPMGEDIRPRRVPVVTEPVVIILNNVTITNPNGPAIHGRRSSNITIIVQDLSTNTLADGTTYRTVWDPTDDDAPPEPGAVIFSQHDIIVSGRGTLNINGSLSEPRWRRTGGPRLTGDTQQEIVRGRGIESRDAVTINGGRLVIRTPDTAIHGRDRVTINNGNFDLNSTYNHGIRASNTTSGGVSIPAFGNVVVRAGLFVMTTRGDPFSAARTLTMTGGNLTAHDPRAGQPGED